MSIDRFVKDPQSLHELAAARLLPVETARRGLPTLTVNKARLHSGVDPLAEAYAQLEAHEAMLEDSLLHVGADELTCVIFGPGLGYLVDALNAFARQHSNVRLRVVCVELDADIAKTALTLTPWTFDHIEIVWCVGRAAFENLKHKLSSTKTVMFRCTADYRQNRGGYDALMEQTAETPARPLRILVPTPLYGGSYPLALHCAEAWRELGHEVDVLDFAEFYSLYARCETVTTNEHHRKALQGLMATAFAEFVVARALEWKADLVWAVAQTPMTLPALQELRHANIASALWFVEDYRLFSYWRQLAPLFDAVFTIQRGTFHQLLKDIGVNNTGYLPVAANPSVHKSLSLLPEEKSRYGADVAFVGAGYTNRRQLFAKLSLPGLKIWGNDWPHDCAAYAKVQENGRRVSTEETAKIYNATAVNLNIHSSTTAAGLDLEGGFINPRVLEIAACSAFQITDNRPELADFFDTNTEIAVVKRAEEIPAKIAYYLSHENERQVMAQKAQARVLREHTYVHRMKTALTFLLERVPRLSCRRENANYISSLKKAVADDTELTNFLSQFPDDEPADLDKIVGCIKLGSGPLSRAEGLFLLMKEFRDWGREKGVIQ